ncbi:stage II sporulation protein M [Bacillus coahuilensis]|uniref:stage II sporulation protein M n=1 Tax=Bacillus coahuilensis TaxID=408580 RepID=UPI000185100F
MNHILLSYFFVMTLFLMGVVFGAIVVNSLSFTQKEDLYFYLGQFFEQVSNDNVASSSELFKQSFFHNIKYVGFIWILGISIIGLPLIFVLLFMKGMVVGFSVGFLVNRMGWEGFLLSFVSVLPQNLIIIPVFIFIAVLSVGTSLQLIRKIFMKSVSNSHMTPIFTRYIAAFIMAVVVLSLAAAVEAYLSPSLMKYIINTL